MSRPLTTSRGDSKLESKGLVKTLGNMFNALPSRFHRQAPSGPSLPPWETVEGATPWVPPVLYTPDTITFNEVSIANISPEDIKRAERCGQGGFGVIMRLSHPTGELALKRLMATSVEGQEDPGLRRALREADTWKALEHPNVLPFLGVLETLDDIYLVSPFVKHGPLSEYVRRNPKVDRRPLLADTAAGISFLHQSGIIHGDIKGSNILVSDDIRALLCDFGLSRHINDSTSTGLQGRGTVRWESPELLERGAGKTTESDMWAFGMTIYEVVSGNIPFYEYNSTSAVIKALIIKDERPPREPTHSPMGISYEPLWKIVEGCWDKDPTQRSPIEYVVASFLPSSHPNRLLALQTLAKALKDRFKTSGDARDMEKSVKFRREALQLHTADHPDRPESLVNLARALSLSSMCSLDARVSDEAIDLFREALQLCPADRSTYPTYLFNFASVLINRFKTFGDAEDLEKAIELLRECTGLPRVRRRIRTLAIDRLTTALSFRSTTYGDIQDAVQSTALQRGVLQPHPKGHPDYFINLNQLGWMVHEKYRLLGNDADLEEATILLLESVKTCPSQHSDRKHAVDSLGSALHSNYQRHGDPTDLAKAIDLLREGVRLSVGGNDKRSEHVLHLGTALVDKFRRSGEFKDLDEADELLREALQLCRGRHMYRYDILLALAGSLRARGGAVDLEEAKRLYLEALEIVEGERPGNIRRHAMAKEMLGEMEDKVTATGDSGTMDSQLREKTISAGPAA